MSATHPLKPFETVFGSSEAHCFYSGTKYRWECLSAFERFGFLNYESSMTTFYLNFLIFKAWREWGRENDCSLTTRPRAAALEAHRERGNLDRDWAFLTQNENTKMPFTRMGIRPRLYFVSIPVSLRDLFWKGLCESFTWGRSQQGRDGGRTQPMWNFHEQNFLV